MGGLGPLTIKDAEKRKENPLKIRDSVKQVGKFALSLAPDLTNPQEIGQEMVELASDVWRAKNPYRGAGLYVGKKLIKHSPHVRKALKTVQPIVDQTKQALNKDVIQSLLGDSKLGQIYKLRKAKLAYETAGDGLKFKPTNVNQGLKINENPLSNNVFAAISKEQSMANLPRVTTGSKEQLALLQKATEYGKKKGNMIGFGNHYVDEKGIWRAFKWNKKTQKASVLDQGGRFDRGVRRIAGEQLDEKTLLNQLGGDKKLLSEYKQTNQTIRRNLAREVKKINKAGNAKYGDKWDNLEVEHIYDVQHFWKLKNEVPNFSGSGANEAINLTAIKKSINQRTGAKAATLSGSDALTKNLEKFPDYKKAVREYTDFDMFNTVKNMKTSDWEGLTQLVLENPNMNVHEILVNYF